MSSLACWTAHSRCRLSANGWPRLSSAITRNRNTMKIVHFETLMANAGLRNYLFLRLHTDTGLTGIGEATLEWQEKTVQTICHEWVEGRILGKDPFEIERIVGDMIRDQYQGGSTVMTAISGVEIALWDIVGKACGRP